MDQRIGVDHLQGAGRGHGRFEVGPAGLGGHQGQDRPEPLAPAQQAVPHRLGQPGRAGGRGVVLGVGGGQVARQGLFDPEAEPPEDLGEPGFGGLDGRDCRHGAIAGAAGRDQLRGRRAGPPSLGAEFSPPGGPDRPPYC